MKKKDKKKIEAAFECLLRKHNIQFENIILPELSMLQQQWREAFSVNVKKKTGHWVYLNNDWHAFSYDFSPHKRGKEAIKEYNSTQVKKFRIIVSGYATDGEEILGYNLKFSEKPSYGLLRKFLHDWPQLADMYISQIKFSWTFVLTHEDDELSDTFGPYFAKKL